MSAIAIVLLFIIIPCAIALIIILSKLRTGGTDTAAAVPEVKAVPTATVQEKNTDTGPLQNTIYTYRARGSYRCPYCDGENGAGAGVCEICGRDI